MRLAMVFRLIRGVRQAWPGEAMAFRARVAIRQRLAPAPRRRDTGESPEGLWCMPEVDRTTLCGRATWEAILAFVGLTFALAFAESFRTQYCWPISGPD